MQFLLHKGIPSLIYFQLLMTWILQIWFMLIFAIPKKNPSQCISNGFWIREYLTTFLLFLKSNLSLSRCKLKNLSLSQLQFVPFQLGVTNNITD